MTRAISLHVGFAPEYKRRIRSFWNYPYFDSWKQFTQMRFKSILGMADYKSSNGLAYLYENRTSFLFVYEEVVE